MNIVPIKPRPAAHVTFDVQVIHDDECGLWVGVCDGLVLATEAPTYEALVDRVWEIAPEMAQENGLNIAPERLRLRFEFAQSFADHRIAL